MNNLEKLLEQHQNGECEPLFGVMNQGLSEKCSLCPLDGNVCTSMEELGCAETRARWLLAEYVEPDSWEKIEADAMKKPLYYWGCNEIDSCGDCPAKIDGETPKDRYGVVFCREAQQLDIVRRCKALAGVEVAFNGK